MLLKYFLFSDGVEKELIRGAFRHYEAQTCIRFVELGITEPFFDYHILITKENTG